MGFRGSRPVHIICRNELMIRELISGGEGIGMEYCWDFHLSLSLSHSYYKFTLIRKMGL